MRYVFSRNNPVLAFNALADDTDRSEQEGMMHLFEGTSDKTSNPWPLASAGSRQGVSDCDSMRPFMPACAELARIVVGEDRRITAPLGAAQLSIDSRYPAPAAWNDRVPGYDVETPSSTVSAMLQMERREFSLALVNLGLPDGDGLHLLRLLKSKDPSLEVILMTGSPSTAKVVEATEQGTFYFLFKPFDLEEMLTLVGKALERRRFVAENSDLRRKVAELERRRRG